MHVPRLAALASLAAACLFAQAAPAADAWPSRPIRMIVPFDAGATSDAIHRYYADQLSKALGQQVVIENMGGAGGAIGAAKVAGSPADGYTLLGTVVTAVAALPHLQKVTYDPLKDFTPIARVGYSISMLGTNTDSSIKSLQNLIDQSKKTPNKFSYGSAGVGSAPQFRYEALMAATGIKLVHVPYKGGSAFVSDLVSGRIQLFADGLLGANLSKSGKARILAVIDDKRADDFPDVPTVKEVVPGFVEPPTWYIIEGPANLPRPIVQRIAAEVAKISARPETVEFLKGSRSKPALDPASFDISAEVDKVYRYYGDMIRQQHIQAQ